MHAHPVTRHLYKAVMGEEPGWPAGNADERPVNNVSWDDALRFCNRLSERAALTPCYRARKPGRWHSTPELGRTGRLSGIRESVTRGIAQRDRQRYPHPFRVEPGLELGHLLYPIGVERHLVRGCKYLRH
jgi:hypothetical protein